VKLTAKSPKKKSKPPHARKRHAVDAAPPVEPAPDPAPPPPPEPPAAAPPAEEQGTAAALAEATPAILIARLADLEERVERLEQRAEGTDRVLAQFCDAPTVFPGPAAAAADEEVTGAGDAIEDERPPVMFLVGPPSLNDWSALGVELARHPHRLALALHVARAATSGGGRLTSHEEDQIATWFGDVVAEGIAHTGGITVDERGGTDNIFARAGWYVLHTDRIRDARRRGSSRCPSLDEVPCPGDPGFVDSLRAAAPGYVRTVIAGATKDEIDELATLLTLDARTLDERYRPFAGPFTEDVHPAETYERALADLTRRYFTNEDVCSGVEGWAAAFAMAAHDHDIPPVSRIGAVVWLARVALHREERAA
jgi:hypothetical protein